MLYDSSSLRNQLLTTGKRFLSALTEGDAALVTFDQYWNTLISQVTAGIQEGWIADDVVELARNTATSIAVYADSHLACEQSVASAIVGIRNDLAGLSLNGSSFVKDTCTRAETPSYISAAYEWLIDNVHNPYPSPSTKQVLASRSGLSNRQIHEWFKTVRRCIGWVDCCKRHFHGSRALTVEAATGILLEHETASSLSLEITVDILSVQGAVECLYPAQYASFGISNNPSLQTPFITKYRGSGQHKSQHSPQMSITLGERPVSSICPTQYSLEVPSVAMTTENGRYQSSPSLPNPSLYRKRRLSDADSGVSRKRTKVVPGEPRRQAVSDPLPRPFGAEMDHFDAFWANIFNPTPTPIITEVDTSRLMSVIPKEWSPAPSEEELAALSSFVASVIPEDNSIPSVTVREPAVSCVSTTPLVHDELSVAMLPFADPSLAMDPVNPLDIESLQLFSSTFPENLFDLSSASLPDTSSDISSILTMSPPRTPALAPSPGLPSSDTSALPPLTDNISITFTSCTDECFSETSSVLNEVLREKDIDRNCIPVAFSTSESFFSFDLNESALSFDFSNPPPLSV